MDNRGRIQAQGKNLEASESWATKEPPTVEDGLKMLNDLREKIPKNELKIREKAFERAEKFIKNTGKAQGVDAPVSVTFRAEGYIKERVDIEIIKGKAFV